MATFDIMKTFFAVDRNHPYAQLMNLILGGSAGSIAVTITYPTDLVRRMMQLSGTAGHPEYSSAIDCVQKLVQ